jgi:hypothetical protein
MSNAAVIALIPPARHRSLKGPPSPVANGCPCEKAAAPDRERLCVSLTLWLYGPSEKPPPKEIEDAHGYLSRVCVALLRLVCLHGFAGAPPSLPSPKRAGCGPRGQGNRSPARPACRARPPAGRPRPFPVADGPPLCEAACLCRLLVGLAARDCWHWLSSMGLYASASPRPRASTGFSGAHCFAGASKASASKTRPRHKITHPSRAVRQQLWQLHARPPATLPRRRRSDALQSRR